MFQHEILGQNEASTPVPPYIPRTPREPVPEEHEEHNPPSGDYEIAICEVREKSFAGRTELEAHDAAEHKSRKKKGMN